MTQASRGFRPGWLLTVLTLLSVAFMAMLGTWQVQRLHWKQDLITTAQTNLALPPIPLPADPSSISDLDFRLVEATGTLRYDKAQVFGVDRSGGRVGSRLLVPLERPDGPAILVDMGWVPEPVDIVLAQLSEPQAEQRITGFIRLDHYDEKPPFKPENETAARRWYWKDTGALALATGLGDLAAMTLMRTPDAAENEPPIAMPAKIDYRNNHLGYAVTWFGLCAGLIGVYVAFGLSRPADRKS